MQYAKVLCFYVIMHFYLKSQNVVHFLEAKYARYINSAQHILLCKSPKQMLNVCNMDCYSPLTATILLSKHATHNLLFLSNIRNVGCGVDPEPTHPWVRQDSLTWYFLHFCTVLSLLKFSTVLYISTFCNFPTLSGSTLSNFWITSSVLSSSSATESVGASLKHLNEEATGLMRDFSTRNTRLLRVFTENTQRFARHETCRVV